MTEKEKARAGLLYDNNHDPEILAERSACLKKCRAYNDLLPEDSQGKDKLIREIFGSMGEDCYVEQPFRCNLGYNIHVGSHFYSNYNLVVLDEAPVSVGDYVFIGPDVGIYTAVHPISVDQRNQGLETARPVTIGNNVWLGGGAKLLPGVTIGDNTVIGAGSVVTKDIPSGVVAVGNPCRVLRELAPEELPHKKW